jgi:hypothetical protein
MVGYTTIELTPLPAKPRVTAINQAWRYLKAAHETVQGVFEGFAVIRDAEKTASGKDTRGRLRHDEANLLRAAIVFTSSGLDACCKRLLRDTLHLLVDGNVDAARKFDDFLKNELSGPPSDKLSDAIRGTNPREEMIRLYIEARTKASLQGSSDVKSRVRDTLGISNARLPLARLTQLNGFFTARTEIVHDLDYKSPTGQGVARHPRTQDWVRDQCDTALALVAEIINEAAANIRALPPAPQLRPSYIHQGAPTPAEERLATAYASVLIRISACAQAVEDGSWSFLETRADEVETAATALQAAAKLITGGTGAADSRTVLAEVMRRAGADLAVQALHSPD